MSEDRKCSKPGCGALNILGQACLDRDCPQMWVHYTAHNAEIDRLNAQLAEARDAALEAAAKVADETHEEAPEDEQLGDEYWSLRVSCNTRSTRIARAIRALKGKTHD